MTATINGRPTYAADYLKGDWEKSVFLDNVHADNLMTAFVGLGGEHWALRRRLMVIETLLTQQGSLTGAEIEAFEPSADLHAKWEGERDDFIKRVYSVLIRDTADMSRPIEKEGGEIVPPRVSDGQS